MRILLLRVMSLSVDDSGLVQVVLVHIFCTHVRSFPLGRLPCRLGHQATDHLYACFMSHLRFSCEEKTNLYDAHHKNNFVHANAQNSLRDSV